MKFYASYDIFHRHLIIEIRDDKYTRLNLNHEQIVDLLNAIPLCVVEKNVASRIDEIYKLKKGR